MSGAYGSDRIILYDRAGEPLGDLSVTSLLSPPRIIDEVNGEHSMTIRTTARLVPGTRALWRDEMGFDHEYVVKEPDEHHRSGEYYLIWSLQHDLMEADGKTHWAAAVEGTHDPIAAGSALRIALSDQTRWQVGDVTVGSMAGASLYDKQVWDYVKTVASVWGGELSATIEVRGSRVVARKVNLLAHVGSTKPTRRFDWSEDVSDIRRTPDPGPYFCRVRPRGGNSKTDNDGVDYSDRIGIEGVTPGGVDYIEDAEAARVFRTLNPDGSWCYPTKVVCYDLKTPRDDEELYNKALADLHNHTRPSVTYEATVAQYSRAGLDWRGVSEGDEIQIVDMGFNPDEGLRLQGRVLRIERDLPVFGGNPSNTELTIGNLAPSMSSAIRDIVASSLAPVSQQISKIVDGGTIVYLQNLIDQINSEINATGGYKYEVPGIGTRTYNTAVSDPAVGAEATQVTEVRGGTLRFANSRTQAGDWDWKTVITADGYLGLAATIARITAGYIGNPSGDFYINFDTHEYRLGAMVQIGDTTVSDLLQDVASGGVSKVEYGTSQSSTTAPTSWSTTVPTSVAKGSWLWMRTTYKDGGTSTTKAYAGTDGTNGDDGVGIKSVVPQYYLSTSSSSATGGSWSSNPPTWSAGRYIWTRSLITWDTTPETTSTTTAVYDAALTQANSQAKAASDAVTALDSSLDQSEVFKRLTNNGALQGLYMEDNQLYVNANYIQSGAINANLITAGLLSADRIHGGALRVGGLNNGNGVIEVYDASDNLIGRWGNDGLYATGELTMVSRGISPTAKSYADIGQFLWTGWLYGVQSPSGKTVYGLRLHTDGENTDGDLIITSKIDTGIVESTPPAYGASAILSKGQLCLSAAAGLLDSNPCIEIGGGSTSASQTVFIYSGSNGSWRHHITVSNSRIELAGEGNYLLRAKATNYAGYDGEVRVGVDFAVNGSKSRIVETDTYGDRLLYCYESPQPLFGDIGGGTIGEDGTCYVDIDDIFSETARCDLSYHVFLQPYGDGKAWVSERTPTHFVVRGTPGLEFAWELKARQVGYEHTRLEDHDVIEWASEEGSYGLGSDMAYADELSYVQRIESLYD